VTRALYVLRYPFSALAGAGLAISLFFLIPSAANVFEARVMPVAVEWTVTEARRDGEDLYLSGTMVKRRPCLYVPPIIVRDQIGQNYLMEHQSAIRGNSWAASSGAQKFGPWKVHKGAGKLLTFSAVYDCHSLWPTFNTLGTFDARGLP
jgi:hypothetical protein